MSAETGATVETVAGVYFGVGGRLDLGWLSQQIRRLNAASHWQGLARVALRDDLTLLARALANSVLRAEAADASDAAHPADATAGSGAPARIAAWQAKREFQLARCGQLLAELLLSSARPRQTMVMV